MKPFNLLLACCLFSIIAKGQDDSSRTPVDEDKREPLFSLLSEVKNMAEYKYRNILKKQELALDTLPDEPKGEKIKERKRLTYYNDNYNCRQRYIELKIYTDQLITQLKADLTLSNKRRLIKDLNEQSSRTNSWYMRKIADMQQAEAALMKCDGIGKSGIGVAEILGIFTAVVDIVKSSRDFRALQIKSLCEQLDVLRLSDIDEGGGSTSKKENNEKENTK